jgi:hypothetical protein
MQRRPRPLADQALKCALRITSRKRGTTCGHSNNWTVQVLRREFGSPSAIGLRSRVLLDSASVRGCSRRISRHARSGRLHAVGRGHGSRPGRRRSCSPQQCRLDGRSANRDTSPFGDARKRKGPPRRTVPLRVIAPPSSTMSAAACRTETRIALERAPVRVTRERDIRRDDASPCRWETSSVGVWLDDREGEQAPQPLVG